MTREEELEFENKTLRSEVDFLRNLVNQLSQKQVPMPIIINPAPIVAPRAIDLTPKIGWPGVVQPSTTVPEPWPPWKHSETWCKIG